MLSAYEVYCTWLGLQTHFKSLDPLDNNTKYNFVTSEGRIRTSETAFLKRPDVKLFKVAKFETTRDVVVAYLSYISVHRGTLPTINDILSWREHEQKTILKWLGKIEALDHTLKSDLNKLSRFKLDYLLKPKTGYPKLIEKWLHGTISIESIILLGKSLNLFTLWTAIYLETPYKEILIQHLRLWYAYSYFLNIKEDNVKQIWSDWRLLHGK